MQLHILGISAERLWHTIRDVHCRPPQNPWDPWEDVMAFAGTPSRNIVMVDCAAVHGQLHVCAITSDERLLHTIRLGPQKWQPWGDAGVVAGLRIIL